jgi:glycosyltransferase involved in cell wall biosynthesis
MNSATTAKPRLGIIISHPIQYFSPWYRALAGRSDIDIKVFYCFQPTKDQQGVGFGVPFEWDVPLLQGYDHEFLANTARTAGLNFTGCDTPSLYDLVASRRFDVWLVSGWNLKSYWQAMRACWRHNVPMMVRGTSNLLVRRPLPVRIAKRLILGRWLPRFSCYLTMGKLNEDYYRFYGASPQRFHRVHHFVDNERFAAQAREAARNKTDLLRRWHIPEKKLVFLFSGKLIDVKRPMDLLAAFKLVCGATQDAHLLVAGEGALRLGCEAYVAANNLPVTFTGFLNQQTMPLAYACADVLVLPSRHETWGLVVNEAMACARPAIVSDKVGCAPDLVLQGETGIVFPAGDLACFADAMLAYVGDPSSASRQGQKAQELVHRTFSVQCATENTVAAVRFALG